MRLFSVTRAPLECPALWLRKGAFRGQRGRLAGAVGAALTSIALLAAVTALAGEWPPAPPLPSAADESPGTLPPSIKAEPVRSGLWSCTFRYKPEGEAKSVTLAGT